MSEQTTLAAETAGALMAAMTRLRARLRTESAQDELLVTWSQLTTLHRVAQEGPVSIVDLARAEHVRRQSMAETVAALRGQGLVETTKDPDDARRTLVRASAEGATLNAALPLAREAWIKAALLAHTSAREQRILIEAAAIMNRLADSEP
ncbi:MarR family transcriptional regulator [Actinospica durhamensis]|uniref:MarR family transcriptional regulator n=1 Tax=Actinospica durhamensis TaxID=1508375 RepID=A0A941IU33_9ACTN|nr:MarR family transcriptional regulator [Actinospica durhamensis]MBR7836833.1 MarR family transcriptional regulator [Actinospica durhamensis]